MPHKKPYNMAPCKKKKYGNAPETWLKIVESFDEVSFPVFLKDDKLRWVYANKATLSLYNLNKKTYRLKTSADLLTKKDSNLAVKSDNLAVKTKKTVFIKKAHQGRYFNVYKIPLYDENGSFNGILVLAPDVSGIEKAKNSQMLIKNIYRALYIINQSIIKNSDPRNLLDNVCKILVNATGAPAVWAGRIDKKGKQITIASQFKKNNNIPSLKNQSIPLDSKESLGKVGGAKCARTGNVQIIHDVFKCKSLKPFWDFYKTSGIINSGAVFPIKKYGAVIYILTVYSEKRNFFSKEIVNLLKEVSLDIGYIFEESEKNERLINLPLQDSLTKIANRILFLDRAQQVVNRAQRNKKLAAVLIIDIKNFKDLNEKFGHKAGDMVLIKISKELSKKVRKTDTVARTGSNEFGIILGNLSNIKDLSLFFNRIDLIFDNPVNMPGGNKVKLDYKMGISLFPKDGGDLETLFKRAETALTHAKKNEKERRHLFSKSFEDELHYLSYIQDEIKDAIASGRIIPYYQPQVRLPGGEIIGLEALARLKGLDGGIKNPADFIPFIENNEEIISSLGEYMIKSAIEDMPKFRNMGIDAPISVNIAAKHLINPAFLNFIEKINRDYGNSIRKKIIFEITETTYLKEIATAKNIFEKVLKSGFSVSLDDFGTGYSTFSYLQDFPVSQIKIDGSFVKDILENNKSLAIIAGIITTSKILGVEVIAEGAETIETAQLLFTLGCDKIQGYVASRPVPIEKLEIFSSGFKFDTIWPELALPFQKKHYELIGLYTIPIHHNMRILQIIEALNNPGKNDVYNTIAKNLSDPESYKKCQVGVWYESLAKNDLIKNSPQFTLLGTLHKNVHNFAHGLIERKKKLSEKEKNLLLDKSKEITRLVMDIISMVNMQ